MPRTKRRDQGQGRQDHVTLMWAYPVSKRHRSGYASLMADVNRLFFHRRKQFKYISLTTGLITRMMVPPWPWLAKQG